MEENIKQALVEALVDRYDMTVEEAEDRILNSNELDGGIGVELMEDMLGTETVELEAVDLSQEGHPFDLNVFSAEENIYNVLLLFHEYADVSKVEGAFEQYEASPLSEDLRIENDIESEDDRLMLAYDIVLDKERTI